MRAILVDDEPYGNDSFKKMLQLNFPEVEIETVFSVAARENPEKIESDIEDPEENEIDSESELESEEISTNNAGYALETRLCLPTQKGFTIVNLEEIVYCEAQRSYTRFHLLNSKSITVSKPLFDYERLLIDSTFLRVHKSFLINLMHVKEYTRGEGGTISMSNNMQVEVSRRKKEKFLRKIKTTFKF